MPEPGFQKPMPYLADTVREEVVDLAVGVEGDLEVDVGADLGLDEVVAVDGGRHGHLGQAGGHELQQRHLGGGVLHGDAVGVEVGVGCGPARCPGSRVAEVVDEDLLGEGERPAEALAARARTRSARRP